MTDQKPTITIAQWCAYLPYGIEIAHNVEFVPKHLTYPNFTLNKNNLAYVSDCPERFKPLLRLMNKENQAEINSIIRSVNEAFGFTAGYGFFCFDYEVEGITTSFLKYHILPYDVVQALLAAHYDLDGLIPQGLALPIE